MDLQDIRTGALSLVDYIDSGGASLDVVAAQIDLLRERLAVIREGRNLQIAHVGGHGKND